jgi:hypothetical protein
MSGFQPWNIACASNIRVYPVILEKLVILLTSLGGEVRIRDELFA